MDKRFGTWNVSKMDVQEMGYGSMDWLMIGAGGEHL
jgi:hypothetical protein